MPVTAADVRTVVFSKPPMGKRGYHEDEVDAFLAVVGTSAVIDLHCVHAGPLRLLSA